MTPAVRAFVDSLQATIARLEQRVVVPERRRGMNTGNSSLPPASDGPAQAPENPTKGPSGKKPGGRPGHVKRSRALIPTAECDRVEHHRPHAYLDCGTKFRGNDPQPLRHQVTDLPPVTPVVIEHQVHTLTCLRCGCRCTGELPARVPRGAFALRVVAVATLLSGLGRVSQ